MPSICLCMIVKDEASVVERCLRSVRGLVQSWAIVDTGSTDGTQDVIRAALAGLPGELVERPWVDFAHNRTEALALARPRADYTLVIDADDELVITNPAAFDGLSADCYPLEIQDAGAHYWRRQLVRNTLPWRYEGILHEFLTVDGDFTEQPLPGVAMRRHSDGARRKDPAVFQRDAALLEHALLGDCSPALRARYTFYLAQTYGELGDRARALAAYLRRAEQGGWAEEVYVALCRAGRLVAEVDFAGADFTAIFQRAASICPHRAEAWYWAARHCRERNQFEAGLGFAQRAVTIPVPDNGLFLERWVYQFGAWDELAVNAYHSGHYWQSADASLHILMQGLIADTERPRLVVNARAALAHLKQ